MQPYCIGMKHTIEIAPAIINEENVGATCIGMVGIRLVPADNGESIITRLVNYSPNPSDDDMYWLVNVRAGHPSSEYGESYITNGEQHYRTIVSDRMYDRSEDIALTVNGGVFTVNVLTKQKPIPAWMLTLGEIAIARHTNKIIDEHSEPFAKREEEIPF